MTASSQLVSVSFLKLLLLNLILLILLKTVTSLVLWLEYGLCTLTLLLNVDWYQDLLNSVGRGTSWKHLGHEGRTSLMKFNADAFQMRVISHFPVTKLYTLRTDCYERET